MDLTQGIPISIQLKTIVQQEGETKDFYFEMIGQIVKIGAMLYIRYKEQQEDGQLVSVTIKIEPDGKIQLIRSGELRMRLKFGYQERIETIYRTPYGLFEIATFTRHLHFSLKDQPIAGALLIDYDLYSQKEQIGEYHLELQFTA